MNGQMYQIAAIVAAAKKALQTDKEITYKSEQYTDSIQFTFLPLDNENYTASNISEWFEALKKNGLQDIKLLCPYSVENRGVLGFSNTTESLILCFFEDGRVTYFTAYWDFNPEQKKWNILYTEQEWVNPPSGKPHFENNTASFCDVLLRIKDLAGILDCENFANVFESAIQRLAGEDEDSDKTYRFEPSQIPAQNLRLFEAASAADVFGSMGSWNDEPSCIAHKKGLDKEYDTLSDELLKNIRLAILYAINEW